MSNDDLPNPFDCARRVPGITVMLKPENVTSVGGAMTRDEAARLLDQHGPTIAARMLAAGVETAFNLAREAGGFK